MSIPFRFTFESLLVVATWGPPHVSVSDLHRLLGTDALVRCRPSKAKPPSRIIFSQLQQLVIPGFVANYLGPGLFGIITCPKSCTTTYSITT